MTESTYIPRKSEKNIHDVLNSGKVIVITGPRRSGKTTLLKRMAEQGRWKALMLNGEDISTGELLERRTVTHYREILGEVDFLVIDEAQHIIDIGLVAKLIHDEIPEKKVILSSSSSFDLTQKSGEPLTGRKITFELLPFSESELWNHIAPNKRQDELRKRMVTGNYPEVIKLESKSDRIDYLRELRDSYLLKDLLQFEDLRNAGKIQNLLRLLAFQTGSEVSMSELGNQLSMSKNTVEKYLDLLSKSYVIFRLEGFSRNLRKEVTKTSKWYFHDNGIMNVVLNNLDDLSTRQDTGALWENYMISERFKYHMHQGTLFRWYFWRTYDRQEIDLVEEEGGRLRGYEIKWKKDQIKTPGAWSRAYPDAGFSLIHGGNYHSFTGI